MSRTHSQHVIARSGTGIILAASLSLAACGEPPAPAGPRINVVAAENFWGNIASQVGGATVHVTSIISDPSADPHLYATNAEDAAAIARADIVITNGLDYDRFMTDLISSSGRHPLEVTVQEVLKVSGSDANPHLWYDVPRVSMVAKAFAEALSRVRPGQTSAFSQNLVTFQQSLQPMLEMISGMKMKFRGMPVAYTERVAGYLLADCGMTVVSPEGFARAIESGSDPSPEDVEAMNNGFAGHRVHLLVYNVQTVSAITTSVRSAATAAGIPVVGVSETQPSQDATYQVWQQRQLDDIRRALGG